MQFNKKLSTEAKSMENVTTPSDLPDTEKPYKSELNLLLLNPGDDSPPLPNVPEPMQPIYPFQYGFERFGMPVETIPFVALTQPPQIPQLPLQIPVTHPEPLIISNVYKLPAMISPPVVDVTPTAKMSAEDKRQIFKSLTVDQEKEESDSNCDGKHHGSGTGEVSLLIFFRDFLIF